MPHGSSCQVEVEAERVDRLPRLGDDLWPGAVAGDHCDSMRHAIAASSSSQVGIAERPSSARHDNAAHAFARTSESRSVEAARERRDERAVEDVAGTERADGLDRETGHLERLAVGVRRAAVARRASRR